MFACAGIGVYLEFTSYYPSRSGSEVVWLEQSYPRPKHFFPVAYAVQSVLLSFSSSNAIVLSRYLWRIVGRDPSPWEMKGVAIAGYTLAVICKSKVSSPCKSPHLTKKVSSPHNKYSLWAINVIGAHKIILLAFISITGFVVLGGGVARIPEPGVNFRNGFAGTTDSGYDLAVSMVNIIFAYTGWQNAFNMANEIRNPVPMLKRYATGSLIIVFVLYFLCNIAYFAAVDKETFAASSEVAASVFFRAVFGDTGAKALNFCVCSVLLATCLSS